jgi:hypothetical protein
MKLEINQGYTMMHCETIIKMYFYCLYDFQNKQQLLPKAA